MTLVHKVVEYVGMGGPVILPIMAVSVWMWTLIFERLFILGRLEKNAPASLIPESPADFDSVVMKQRCRLKKRLPFIAVLAASCPLIGLLGTVTGMMKTFDVISGFGTGKALAGGISEALITTQTGLVAAIPGLYMSVFLKKRASGLENTLDKEVLRRKRLMETTDDPRA